MAFELVLLGALIFIFIVSFCGLLQKIKQTYDRERLLAERIARRREHQHRAQRGSSDSFVEVFANPAYSTDGNESIFPAAPPPYSQYYMEAPPNYDEVVKVHQLNSITSDHQNDQNDTEVPENRSSTDTGPPPYTINLTLVNETSNRV